MADQKLTKLANDLAPLLRRKLSTTTIGGGTGSGGGVVDHGQLTGLADNDHPQYLLRSGGNTMAGPLNLAGNDLINVGLIDGFDINGFSGTLTALEVAINALETRTVLAGDGLDSNGVQFGDGSPTLSVDVTDLIGAGLTEDGSNNLMVRAGDGIALAGNFTTVDEDFDFQWTGRQTWADTISSATWVSGDLGIGWGVTAAGVADFREIYSEAIIAKAFVVDATIVEKGSLTLTPSRATLAADFLIPSSGYATLTVFDVEGLPAAAAFASGTYVRLRVLSRASGLVVGDAWGTVATYADQGDGTQTWRWTYVSGLSGITVYAGAVALGYGSSGAGLIDMTTVQANSPYLDVKTWTTSPVSGSNYTTHLRLGNLAGISDPDIGGLSGWGLYTDQLVARGTIIGADGAVVIDAVTGANLQARANADEASDPGTEINWTTSPLDPESGRDVARMLGFEYTSGGLVTHNLTIEAQIGLADNRSIVLKTEASGSQQALIGLYSGASANRVLIQSVADGGGNGQIDLVSEIVNLYGVVIRPNSDLGTALGDGSHRFSEVHVDVLYAGTVSATDTGTHNHNDLYHLKSEISTLLGGYATIGHTHTGYATTVWVATQLAAYALDGHDHDADYYTQGYLDTEFAKYALVGHAHDTLYYQKSEIATLLTSTLASYVTSSALTSTLASYVTSSALTSTLASYVASSALTSTLAGYATLGHSHTSFDSAVTFNADIDVNGAAVVDDLTVNVAATLDRIIGAEVAFEDGSGAYAKITSTGIDSLRPAFSSGVDRSGLRLTWEGDVNARDITAVNLSTFVFERHQVGAVGNTLAIATAGKLYADASLSTVGASVSFDVAEPEAGAEQLFAVDDVVRISGMAYANVTASAETATMRAALPFPFMPAAAVDREQFVATAYMTITAVTLYDGFARYSATYQSGPANISFLKGTGLVRWSGGMIVLSSDGDAYAPYIDIFGAGSTPWVAGSSTRYVRLGRLDGLGVVSGGEQYGLALGTNLDDSTAARIVGSDLGLDLFRVGFTANDGTYDTVSIESSGRVRFGTNVEVEETTFFDFDPSVDDGAYASLIVRARLQSTRIELPQGEVAVYSATDLFDEGYGDYWTARMNRYGVQMTAGAHDAYTTVSEGIHRFTDQAFEIRNNATADIGTPSEYPLYRVSANSVGATTGYVAHDEEPNYGYYQGLSWNYHDPVIKHLAMFAPDATESGQLYSTSAVMEFGFFNLATGGEFTMLSMRSDEEGYGGVMLQGENAIFTVATPATFVREVNMASDVSITVDPDDDDNPTYFVLKNLPTSDAGLPRGAVWSDAGTLKVA